MLIWSAPTGIAMFEREYAFYKANHGTLLACYRGKSLVIVGEQIIGAYASEDAAFAEALKQNLAPGEFMVTEPMTDDMEWAQFMGVYVKE